MGKDSPQHKLLFSRGMNSDIFALEQNALKEII